MKLSNTPIKYIVFDWDGTLYNSQPKTVESIRQAADYMNLPIPENAEIVKLMGFRIDHLIQRLFPTLDRTDIEDFHGIYTRAYANIDSRHYFFDQTEQVVEALYQFGYKLAIATNKRRAVITQELNAGDLQEYFSVLCCAGEAKPKPHPEMLGVINNTLGFDAKEGLMVGDTTYDMEMANAIRMSSVAITHGAHSTQKLRSSLPDFCIHRLLDLLLLIPLENNMNQSTGESTWVKVS